MSPFTLKLRPGFRSYVLAVAVVCGALSANSIAFAQDDALLEDTESVLNSEQIDVDGQFSKKETRAQKLAKMRKKIEQEHEQMVQKKIEDIRMQEELKLGQKLKNAFSGQLQNVDEVSTAQAAPQRVVAPAPAPAPAPEKIEKNNSIVPTLGLTSISVDGSESYESELSAGINFESKLTNRFAVGIGLGYTTMKITDVNNQNNYTGFNTFGTFNNCTFGSNCFNTFGTNGYLQGREMSYKQMDLNIDGKFFITPDSKIKPFVGLGLGYRRATLKYTENDPYFNQSIGGYGTTGADSEYSSNYVTGTVSGGADIAFSDVIGARLQLSYTKGLTDSSNTDNRTTNGGFGTTYDYNQLGLEQTGKALEGADFSSLSAGLIISF